MAELTVTGRIIQILPPQGGTSKAGNPWRKQEYVLETTDNYPKKIAFHFFNDRIDQNPLAIGDMIKLQFEIECREYNERWYTDIRGWRADKIENESLAQNTGAGNDWQSGRAPVTNGTLGPHQFEEDENDQLPF